MPAVGDGGEVGEKAVEVVERRSEGRLYTDLSDELGKEVEGSWRRIFDFPLLKKPGWDREYVHAVLEEIRLETRCSPQKGSW